MPELEASLNDISSLHGEITVYNGSFSSTQFAVIWDQIVERIDSSANPPITVIDDELSTTSKHPVENRVVSKSLEKLYALYPTTTFNGDGTNNIVTFEDGADGIPLENLIIEIGPVQSGSGDPSTDNIRSFTKITNLFICSQEYLDEQDQRQGRIAEYSLGSVDSLYAGRLDCNANKIYKYKIYPQYDGETLVGPWVSSMDVYAEGTTPTNGATVIDLGELDGYILFTYGGEILTKYCTEKGYNKYTISSPTAGSIKSFELLYHSDPKLYVDMALGLTAAQRQALIDLLDD